MIMADVGRGGSGKTYNATRRLRRLYKAGRDIVSNTPLVDLRVQWDAEQGWHPVDPESFGLDWAVDYVKTFEEIYDLDNCEVLLDEVAAWMPSHLHTRMPEEVRRFLAQDRREGVNIHWTHRTTRVFHELLENTAEIVRWERFGPLLHGIAFDPEDRDAERKGIHRWGMVTPQHYDLYQTLARVGNAKGEGYGLGKRTGYKASGRDANLRILRDYGPHGHSLFVRPAQLSCLMRKFDPEYLGFRRESRRLTGQWADEVGIRWVSRAHS